MSTDPAHFDRLYAADPDPWGFETSAYEAAKLRACLDLLPEERFARGLELGCSIGVMSEALAARCGRFLGLDTARAAIDRARARRIANAEFRVAHLPRDWPDGGWDLIVLSEFLYFLDAEDIALTASRVASSLAPGGTLLLCCWLGPTETELDGRAAQSLFVDRLNGIAPFDMTDGHETDAYAASIWRLR
ncbi:class I SAM-dependent methyltransferase [Wenxinia saemankumensis]|uniref:Nodulation protein S (NodS) n=1 Tax=Wenxinia saemankumensis TaxID=1447782 RepID=A0A1M6HTZ6_9RHOB|nr:SAM-dependent methyltransferase [Wenxinia saemankumensis]SHJ25709.1 Nodulation protein S (NodS) [Wenxinia saemankumensis]